MIIQILVNNTLVFIGVVNDKSETRQDAKTGILKSETETKKCSDLIEKQICDRQTQNLRLRDPLLAGCTRFWDLDRVCRDFSFFRVSFTTPIYQITIQISIIILYVSVIYNEKRTICFKNVNLRKQLPPPPHW